MPDLILQNVSISEKQRLILNGISTEFKSSNLNMILGKNGSGKTLLLRSILQLTEFSGKITFGSQDIASLGINERARLMCWLPTHIEIPFDYSVLEIVMLGRFALNHGDPSSHDVDCCKYWLTQLDILHFEKRSYLSLSKGEQTKVQIARCLASECPILIFDEVCANLDIGMTIKILRFLRLHAKLTGKTVIISHHDIHTISGFADRLLFLKEGKILGDGESKDIFSAEILKKTYDTNVELVIDGDQKIIKIF